MKTKAAIKEIIQKKNSKKYRKPNGKNRITKT